MSTQRPNQESDEKLILQVLGGDHDRFGVLVFRHDALVRRAVGHWVVDPVAIEDAVQETWCLSFRRLSALADYKKLAPWLVSIAARCAQDHNRKRRKNVATLAFDVAAPQPVEDSDWLWEMIGSMPEAHAEVLTRHYRANESYDEIAAALQINRSTVRGRIYQARLELKRRLGDKKWTTE